MEADDEGVRRHLPDGSVEAVRWDDLVEVRVVTSDQGPAVDDVVFLLAASAGRGCAVPQGLMPDGLLARLQALAGFDNEALIKAMGSTDNAQFVCWVRP